jgi:hypothetical protein
VTMTDLMTDDDEIATMVVGVGVEWWREGCVLIVSIRV